MSVLGCEMALMCQRVVSQLRNTLQNGLLKCFYFFPWAAKMFFFFPFRCKMISKQRNGLWKHLVKPREIVKIPTKPRTMHLKRRALSLRSHTRSLSLHFWPPKTIRAHGSSWELQLRRLCHLRRLPKQRSKSWFKRPPQMHRLHRTLPLLDHLFYFLSLHIILVYTIPCFDVLYSGIGGIHWLYLIFYFLILIYRHHFCLTWHFSISSTH